MYWCFFCGQSDFVFSSTGEFHNDPYADDDHGWGYNGYTANRLDDQFFLGKDVLVAPNCQSRLALCFLTTNQSKIKHSNTN